MTFPRVYSSEKFLDKVVSADYKAKLLRECAYSTTIPLWPVGDEFKFPDWETTILDENTIIEDYVGPCNENLQTRSGMRHYLRFFVKKEKNDEKRVDLGLFVYDFENSTIKNQRIWRKISNRYC